MWIHEGDISTANESERQQQFARINAKAILSCYKAGAWNKDKRRRKKVIRIKKLTEKKSHASGRSLEWTNQIA